MRRTNKVYLQDILEAIVHIETYVKGLDYDRFCEDTMCQDAVIRRFEIIGEAFGRLTESFRTKYPQFPVRQSKAMRNVLVHEYSEVDLHDVWVTIETDLPPLKKQLEEVLSKLELEV